MNHLPKLTQPVSPGKPADQAIHFSPILAEVAQLEVSAAFTRMNTAAEGLSEQEAAARVAQAGPMSWRLAGIVAGLGACSLRRAIRS